MPAHSEPVSPRARSQVNPIAGIVAAQLFGTALWFTPNGAAPELARVWGLSTAELGYLVMAVQAGFIAGTLLISLTGFADHFPASRIFIVSALLGALANASLVFSGGGLPFPMLARFVTGVCLAGIYPLGMKLVVSWAPQQAGRTLAWLIAMLNIGTASPHLVRALGFGSHWQVTIVAPSLLAIGGAGIMAFIGDGPYLPGNSGTRAGLRDVLSVFRIPAFRASALGYFGHMWELYAFWTIAPFLIASLFGGMSARVSLLAFCVIAIGGLGSIAGGHLSIRFGSACVAAVALAISGAMCAIYPWLRHAHVAIILAAILLWGFAVVPDSPQFSAISARVCPPQLVGSALAIQNSIGFFISIISIQIVTAIWPSWNEASVWVLVPGPALGLIAMCPLFSTRRSEDDA